MMNYMQTTWKHYQNWILAVLLVVLVGIVYLPSLTSYFVSDDFTYIAWMFFNSSALLAGEKWRTWLVEGIDPQAFRPGGLVFLFVNYLMAGTSAFGYHLADLLLHIFSCILTYLIAWRLIRHRPTAIATAALFAIQPTHAGAVSWVGAACYDTLGGFLCLTSFLFFVLYRQKNKWQLYIASFAFFILALLTKEIAITFPAAILAYDLLYNQPQSLGITRAIKTHFIFWLGIGVYLYFRFFVLGIFGYKGTSITLQDALQWVIGTFINIGNPFISSAGSIAIGIFLLTCLGIVIGYRKRREILFGGAWILITFFPVIGAVSGPSERSFYLASFGLVLMIASILLRPLRSANTLLHAIGIIILIFVGLVYGIALFQQNQLFQRASQVAETIPTQVKRLHPTLEPNVRLIFIGVPDRTPEGALIYITGFGDAMSIAYGRRVSNISKFQKFPIWLDDLSHTYLFQIDHRQVIEQTDLLDALKTRQACSNFSQPAITWNFAGGLQSWDAWNDLDDLATRDGVLVAHAVGNDPILGSPSFDIPSIAIGDIVITMRAKAPQPTMHGNIYWLATNQPDFYPGLNKSFVVQADSEFHTYRIDLAQTGALLIGDHITQLRFDPVDAPAEIAIQNIEITTHCSLLNEQRCTCGK